MQENSITLKLLQLLKNKFMKLVFAYVKNPPKWNTSFPSSSQYNEEFLWHVKQTNTHTLAIENYLCDLNVKSLIFHNFPTLCCSTRRTMEFYRFFVLY